MTPIFRAIRAFTIASEFGRDEIERAFRQYGSSGFTYTIPMLLFSIFSQKYIVKGLTLGAVSG